MKQGDDILSQLERHLRFAPFLRLLLPLIAGILVGYYREFDSSVLFIGISALLVSLFFRKRTYLFSFSFFIALFFVAIYVTQVSKPSAEIPRGKPLLLKVEVQERIGESRGIWNRYIAVVEAYRTQDSASNWIASNEKVMLFVDTILHADNMQMIYRGYINPISDSSGKYEGYRRYLYNKSIIARSYVPFYSLIDSSQVARKDYFRWFRDQTVAHFREYGLEGNTLGVSSAVTVGERRFISKDLSKSYSVTGVAHVLSVSGLHLGLIVMMLSLLLNYLHLLPYGRWIRCLLLLAFIWAYAAVTGFGAPVLRSAVMISVFILLYTNSRRENRYNTLYLSAFLILIFRPLYLFDASFQLSFSALLSIMYFYPQFSFLARKIKYPALKYFADVMIVSFSAQIGVLPFVIYYFGNVPLLGLLLNPIVITTTTVLLFFGLLFFVFMWIPFLGEGTAWVIKMVAGFQNWTVESFFKIPLVALTDVQNIYVWLPLYLLFLISMIILGRRLNGRYTVK